MSATATRKAPNPYRFVVFKDARSGVWPEFDDQGRPWVVTLRYGTGDEAIYGHSERRFRSWAIAIGFALGLVGDA